MPTGVDLCLPRFSGSIQAPLRISGQTQFGYPSSGLAERDVRSALHLQGLLARHVDLERVRLLAPEDLDESGGRIRILFGSRSNSAFAKASRYGRLDRLVRFRFGDRWTITGQNGHRYSIPDPSRLSRQEYESHTDYCVVARVRDRHALPVFLISGLGGRSTEGGGRFLAEHWKHLQGEFGSQDFAVVLAFPPPVTPEVCSVIEKYAAPALKRPAAKRLRPAPPARERASG